MSDPGIRKNKAPSSKGALSCHAHVKGLILFVQFVQFGDTFLGLGDVVARGHLFEVFQCLVVLLFVVVCDTYHVIDVAFVFGIGLFDRIVRRVFRL